MQAPGNTSSSTCEINVTPLIDVLLVLLIIFMVIVPVMPRGLPSAVPQGSSAAAAPEPIVVTVRAGIAAGPTQYAVNSRTVSYDRLGPTLQSYFASHPAVPVFVLADRSLSFQRIASVVGEARRSGAQTIALRGL